MLVPLLLVNPNTYLFINVDKNNDSFLTKVVYSIISVVSVYCIYDWGFGILSNFGRIYFRDFLEGTEHNYLVPTVVFFLRMLERQLYLVTEAKHVGALGLGPAEYESSGCIDYPIPVSTSLCYSYFFF